MIKCRDCDKEADEMIDCIPLCSKCFNKRINATYQCPICKEEFRLYDNKGNKIDGSFATMHDECYMNYIDGLIDFDGNPITKEPEKKGFWDWLRK